MGFASIYGWLRGKKGKPPAAQPFGAAGKEDVYDWVPVTSSNVEAIRYDREKSILYVRFLAKGRRPSSVYRYNGVPLHVYLDFVLAASSGKFVWRELRDKYPYAKIG